MREAAPGTPANSVALYRLELADVEGRTLASAEAVAAKAVWGPTRCSQAKEVPWGLLTRTAHSQICATREGTEYPTPKGR